MSLLHIHCKFLFLCFFFFRRCVVTVCKFRDDTHGKTDESTGIGPGFLRFDPLPAFLRILGVVFDYPASFQNTTDTITDSKTAVTDVPIRICMNLRFSLSITVFKFLISLSIAEESFKINSS